MKITSYKRSENLMINARWMRTSLALALAGWYIPHANHKTGETK